MTFLSSPSDFIIVLSGANNEKKRAYTHHDSMYTCKKVIPVLAEDKDALL
jgi:hypothetical protein